MQFSNSHLQHKSGEREIYKLTWACNWENKYLKPSEAPLDPNLGQSQVEDM